MASEWHQNGKIAAFVRSLVTDFLAIVSPSSPGHVIPGKAPGRRGSGRRPGDGAAAPVPGGCGRASGRQAADTALLARRAPPAQWPQFVTGSPSNVIVEGGQW